MSILGGFQSFERYLKTSSGYQKASEQQLARDVLMNNGNDTSDNMQKFAEKINNNINDIQNNISHLYNNLYNPNLLINGDFQVWQRGATFTGGLQSSYTADRWKVYKTPSGNVTRNYLNENISEISLTFSNGSESSPNYIKQTIEVSKQLKKILLEQKATISFELYNNSEEYKVISFGIGNSRQQYSLADTGLHRINGTFSLSEDDFTEYRNDAEEVIYLLDCTLIEHGDYSDIPLKIALSWAKVEIGEYATPFISKSYAEELVACQRYYYILPYAQYIMSCGATGNFYLHSEWVTNHMRNTKTVTLEGLGAMVVCYDNKQEQANITGVLYAYNSIQINTNLPVSYGTYYTYFNNEATKICVDAEIY